MQQTLTIGDISWIMSRLQKDANLAQQIVDSASEAEKPYTGAMQVWIERDLSLREKLKAIIDSESKQIRVKR